MNNKKIKLGGLKKYEKSNKTKQTDYSFSKMNQ